MHAANSITMAVDLAIIGGTGMSQMNELEIFDRKKIDTPYGQPSAEILLGRMRNTEVAFLARHGRGHTVPPHKINYRANIWALKSIGVRSIIGVAAVGGIREDMAPGLIVIPEQVIDYSHDRQATFFEDHLDEVTHIDFTEPYSQILRKNLIDVALSVGVNVIENGTYGCTQGPRLETAAEITRMERDGCDIVGMTGMPEASLARELKLDYACCAVVANWAAGKTDGAISMDSIAENVNNAMEKVKRLLEFIGVRSLLLHLPVNDAAHG